MDDLILVSSWEQVELDSFYLTKEWDNEDEDTKKEARQLAKEGKLYYGYIVRAKDYAIYCQMDADEVFIDGDGNVIISAESQVIDNEHTHKEEYNY